MSTHNTPFHSKWPIIVGRGTVSHHVGITAPSGAFIAASVWPGRLPKWAVYTASGENVHTYATGDLHLAVAHINALGGNQEDMGAWDGPSVVTAAPAYQHRDDAFALYAAIVFHASQVVANEDFNV